MRRGLARAGDGEFQTLFSLRSGLGINGTCHSVRTLLDGLAQPGNRLAQINQVPQPSDR